MTQPFRHIICNLLVFVLLFNTLTPIAVSATQDLLGEQNKVLVCTSAGFNWVETSSFDESDPSQRLETQLHCAMCLLPDSDHNAINSQSASILITNQTILKRPRQSERVSSTLYLHEQGSRAPPVKV